MFQSNFVSFLKRCWLYITLICRRVFKNIGYKLSFILIAFSFSISLFFLIPPLFSKVPVFSYFYDTLSLPISYEFDGKVILINSEEEVMDQMVVVSIGGYSVQANSGEDFKLVFTSNTKHNVYAVIEYIDENKEKAIATIKLDINNTTKLKQEIKIYV